MVRVRTEDDAAYVGQDRADALVVNANLLEWRPAWIADRLSSSRLPNLIDPVLWRFQVPAWWKRQKDNQPKINYARLAAAYQQNTGIDLSDGICLPDSGQNEAWAKLARNVVTYQRSRAVEAFGGLLELLDIGTDPTPIAIVAPYLLARDTSEDSVNRVLLAATAEAAGAPVVAHLAIPIERAHSPREFESAVAALDGTPLAGLMIWIERCTESRLMDSSNLLQQVTDVTAHVSSKGVPVWHGHGGFATAALLRDAGLTGIVHSCAWADRGSPAAQAPSFVQPTCLTYIPGLAETRPFDFARSVGETLDRDTYVRLYCDCAFCGGLFERGEHPVVVLTEEKTVRAPHDREAVTIGDGAMLANLFHYLLARHQEMATLYSGAAVPDIVAEAMRRGDELIGHAQNLHRLHSLVA